MLHSRNILRDLSKVENFFFLETHLKHSGRETYASHEPMKIRFFLFVYGRLNFRRAPLNIVPSKLHRIVDSYEINCRIVRHEIYRHVYPCVLPSIAQYVSITSPIIVN